MRGTCIDWKLYSIDDAGLLAGSGTRLCFTAPDEQH
jgi:hypothetical protein